MHHLIAGVSVVVFRHAGFSVKVQIIGEMRPITLWHESHRRVTWAPGAAALFGELDRVRPLPGGTPDIQDNHVSLEEGG